jgi:acyl-CoA thioester hydrolase
VASIPVYRTPLEPAWLDYNGHLRDAYYGLIVSYATDALMDLLGIDAAYRRQTACTLYTLEMHLTFLKEVRQGATVVAGVRILGADAKRIHAAFELWCEGAVKPAAGAEIMLLHVQQGATTGSRPFPPPVADRIAGMLEASSGLAAEVPGSRVMALRRPPQAPVGQP